MLAAIVIFPLGLEVLCILVRTRFDADNGAAGLDAVFVDLRSLFGNAPADECADQAAGQTACTGSSQGRSNRSPYNQAQAGQNKISADRSDAADEAIKPGQAAADTFRRPSVVVDAISA